MTRATRSTAPRRATTARASTAPDALATAAEAATPAVSAVRRDPAIPPRFAFTPLEDAVVHSERRWPITIQLEAHLRERVDPARLQGAIDQALRAHPMAAARRAPLGRFGRVQRWEIPAWLDLDPLSVTACTSEDLAAVRDAFVSQAIDVSAAPLFRVLLARLPHRDVILLSVHHGMCDGIGAVALLRSIADAYADPAYAPGPLRDPFHELDRRTRPAAAGPDGAAEPESRQSAARAVLAFARSPRADRVAAVGARAPDDTYTIVLERLDAHETHALRTGRASRAAEGITVNDLLVAASHLTVERWNLRHGNRSGRITVTVPTTARAPHERDAVVANLTLQSSTVSDAAMRRDPSTLAAAIAAQTAHTKRDAGATEPAAVLGAASVLPARLRARVPALVSRVTRDRFVDSTRLSNLGRFDASSFRGAASTPGSLSARGFVVDHLWFSPPVRMPQGITIGALSLDGSLHVALRACRELCDPAAADELATVFREALDALR